jgi:hypothetical protein
MPVMLSGAKHLGLEREIRTGYARGILRGTQILRCRSELALSEVEGMTESVAEIGRHGSRLPTKFSRTPRAERAKNELANAGRT